MRISIVLLLFTALFAGCSNASNSDVPGANGGSSPREDETEPASTERSQPADSVRFFQDLPAYFPDMDELLAASPAIGSGEVTVLNEDAELNISIYARTLGRDVVVVAINAGHEAHSLRVELPEELRFEYEIALASAPEGYRLQQDATALLLELPEHFGLILIPRRSE